MSANWERGLLPLPACAHRSRRPPPLPNAACLAATLREYQLEGLRWLVQMWDAGMNAILAGAGVGSLEGGAPWQRTACTRLLRACTGMPAWSEPSPARR